ncbi:MAG: DUF4396 domain-containing protein [Pseudomonadota bacterium]
MLDGVLLLWFILTGLSLLFVIWDGITNTPVSWVQKLAWILVTAYTGPVGLFLYLLACRNPGPRLHSAFTQPHWKQAVNSEMHCLAGDATGIIFAAFVVYYFGLANGIDLIFEYVSGFVVGLFIFQAMMMKAMYGDYATAVKKTFFAETVSMNMVMTGMFPVMVILMHHLEGADDPFRPLFWFVMGMASIAGGLTAYPINSWLVRNHLKHGCMTLPEADEPAPKLGHKSMDMAGHEGMSMPGGHSMASGDMAGMEMGAGSGGGEDQPMEMGTLPLPKMIAIIAGTFAGLLLALWITSTFFAPITF